MQKKLFLLLPLLALLSSCASGPALEAYPRAYIDRPFTMPKGVAAWHIGAVADFTKDEFGRRYTTNPFPYPFIWDQALSDNWQLTWMPLPFLLKHQISHDSSGYLGLNLGMLGGHSSLSGTYLQPFVSLELQRKLKEKFALNGSVDYGRSFWLSNSSRPYAWGAGVQVLALFQLSPELAVSAARESILEHSPPLGFSNKLSWFIPG